MSALSIRFAVGDDVKRLIARLRSCAEILPRPLKVIESLRGLGGAAAAVGA
jgi:hypothetical protein